jgi:hypothetical protein
MEMIPLIREAYETIDCAAARLFAQECGIGHPTKFYKNLIKVFVPNLGVAKALLKSKFELLSVKCAEWGQDKLTLPGVNARGFLVHRVHLQKIPCSVFCRGGSLPKR